MQNKRSEKRAPHLRAKWLLLIWFAPTLWANEAPALPEHLRAVVSQCANCHGENGVAVLPNAPNLAGQNPIYTEIQLKYFRDGKRQNAVMNVVAKALSDEDISALATFYAELKGSQ